MGFLLVFIPRAIGQGIRCCRSTGRNHDGEIRQPESRYPGVMYVGGIAVSWGFPV